jgi:hypothetical protein
MRVEGLAVLGEIQMATLEPDDVDIVMPGVLDDTPRRGLVGQVGYSVWMLEPYVRYSSFDDHREIEDNGDVAELQGGVTWHGGDDMLRAGLAYLHRMENGGTEAPNDTARLWMQLSF